MPRAARGLGPLDKIRRAAHADPLRVDMPRFRCIIEAKGRGGRKAARPGPIGHRGNGTVKAKPGPCDIFRAAVNREGITR